MVKVNETSNSIAKKKLVTRKKASLDVGVAGERSMGEKGDSCNTLSNKEFKFKKGKKTQKTSGLELAPH